MKDEEKENDILGRADKAVDGNDFSDAKFCIVRLCQ
jgi:hypothetical protein